jgi:N-acetylmuramoyl-L-alanine amidase
MKIVIDAGHGGHDPGAVNLSVGVEEKAINLQVAIALYRCLLDAGHSGRMTRTDDRFLVLSERVAIANLHHPDAFVSIHCNAAANKDAFGMEVWTSPGKTRSDALATAIGEALASTFPAVPMRRDDSDFDLDKEGRLYVLTQTVCPAVLIECGFISNDAEAVRLKDPLTIRNLALAISFGISTWGAG